MRVLLQNKADVDMRDMKGFVCKRIREKYQMVFANIGNLLKASFECYPRAVLRRFTALMWACASGSTSTTQVLLEEGDANVNVKVSMSRNIHLFVLSTSTF